MNTFQKLNVQIPKYHSSSKYILWNFREKLVQLEFQKCYKNFRTFLFKTSPFYFQTFLCKKKKKSFFWNTFLLTADKNVFHSIHSFTKSYRVAHIKKYNKENSHCQLPNCSFVDLLCSLSFFATDLSPWLMIQKNPFMWQIFRNSCQE